MNVRMKQPKKAAYSGAVTTTGNSDAIRFEKALFKACPEFRQKAKVKARPIGPGQILISLSEAVPAPSEDMEDDPMLAAFLAFLEKDISEHPERIRPLDEAFVERAWELVKDVQVIDEELM
jgi:antitoxin PrlF